MNGIRYTMLLVLLCCGVLQIYAQQTNTGLEDKLILSNKENFLICNDEGTNFVANADNGTTYAGFKDGTYEIDQGDGQVFSNLSMNKDFPFPLSYKKAGTHTLKFSVLTTDGVKVTREYQVRTLGRPAIKLEKTTQDVQCIGSEIKYLVNVYEQNTAGTKYTLYYDDGSSPDVMTNDELRNAAGKFRHIFDHSYCDQDHQGSSHTSFVLKLSVVNECHFSPDEITMTEFVAEPINAAFTFDSPIPGQGCTFEKTRLLNITSGGNGSNCDPVDIMYEWDFGNGQTSRQPSPEVTFEEAKDYKIRLIASNKYSCARDTAYGSVFIIESVKADFKIDRKELCINSDLPFTNLSKGGGKVVYQWNIYPEGGRPLPEIIGGNATVKDPVIRFAHWGKYRVELIVSNSCSVDTKDTVITVYQNPEIVYSHLQAYDSICPQTAGALRMDLQDYFGFAWNGNPNKPNWKITPADGVQYEPGYGPDSEFPRFALTPGKTYEISVELDAKQIDGVECGDPAKRKMVRKLKVNDPQIIADISTLPAAADRKLNICAGTEISFVNHSTGEGLKHGWSVIPLPGALCDPDAGVVFRSGNAASASPILRFDGYGDYIVTDTLKVYCDKKLVQFQVHVGKSPTMNYLVLPSAVCPGEQLDMSDFLNCDFYNNTPRVKWEFDPAIVTFVDGTSINSVYPHIRLNESGTIRIKASIDSTVCPMPNTSGSRKAEVRVRQSALQSNIIITKRDICERTAILFRNEATDPEGDLKYEWSIDPDQGLEIVDGNMTKEQVMVRFNTWGTYVINAKVKSYCDEKTSDPKEVLVHRNPEVMLKDSSYCPGVVNFDAARVNYSWFNNPQQVKGWEIVREDGADQPGDYQTDAVWDLQTLHPRIDFRRPGRYKVRVTLNTAGCPAGDPVAESVICIYDPVVYGDIAMQNATLEQPALADICEGDVVTFANTMQEEANGLRWQWSMVNGPAEGWEYTAGSGPTDAQPQFKFKAYGNYRLKVITYSTCNLPVEKYFDIVVRGIPELVFQEKMKRICAGDGVAVDMARYMEYKDRKNAVIVPEWSISPGTGFSWEPGFGADSDYPRIQFAENAHYVIQLTAYSRCAAGGKQVLSSEVDVISAHLQSAFSVGLDSVGCVNDPAPYEIALNNTSVGDSLKYTWTVLPEAGREWVQGDGHTESPRIRVSGEGNYGIRLQVTNGCATDDSVFTVKAFGRPTIQVASVADECEIFRFSARDRVKVNTHNDTLRIASWTITPNPGYTSEGYASANGTTLNSFYPDIDFNTCDYTVEVEYYNRCTTPGRASFQVKVDKFIPIQPLDNDAICELVPARELSALPAGGYWTLKDPALPGGDRVLYQQDGKYYFNPAFGAYEEKDVQLVYNLRNLSCVAHDTMNMHVWPLPFVEAGDPLEMCLNHEPVLLVGKDSVTGSEWHVNRGYWRSGAEQLVNSYFTAHTPGDFKLYYDYTDANTCRNVDSTVMTVRALPGTGFTVADKNCIYQPVLFTPEFPENTTFEWLFGDNTVAHSDDTITHRYDDYGYRDVICRAENQYHCKDTSESHRIEIVNLPPPAFFDVDTLGGCAPFEVKIGVDRSVYADDHNYLSFHWNYGEGTETDTLGPVIPKFYPSGTWDTTYVTRFTVSNMCKTHSYDTAITVYSVPKVSFALMHDWECSPVYLELQNTTTGNNCVFNWTFTNKRTGEVIERTGIRNPAREFVTDSASTTFYISLKAVNQCNEDEFTDSLVVKPRQISAHFTPLEHAYACVNQEIFFRNNSSDTVATILNTYWNFGDGERTNVWEPRHKYDAPGTYTVSLKIDNGCGWDTISSPVNIFALPRLEIKSQDQLCETDTFRFAVKSDQELGFIEWKFGDGHVAHRDSLHYVYDGYGTFPVTVIGASAEVNQCTDSVTKNVVVYNKPMMTILVLDTVRCSPLLYLPEIIGDANLMLDYGDGTGLTSAREHWFENLTDSVQQYQIRIYAETDKGCKSQYERNVKVMNNPRAVLDKKVERGRPQKVTFRNLSEGATDCIWELPFRGLVHTKEDQLVEFSENGTYPVSLTVQNYWGCRDTAILEHEVLIKGLYFPNTFIPHSLNNKVNRFNGIGMGLVRYKLEIFDLYNNKLWETRALRDGKPFDGWDGYNAKGEKMPQGIYIWRAEAIFADDEVWTGKNNESGVPETMQGTVMLLRE